MEAASGPGHLRAVNTEDRKSRISKKFTKLPSQHPIQLPLQPPPHSLGVEVSGWDPTAALPDVPACEPQAQAGRGSKWERDVPVPGASGMVGGRGLSPGLPWTAELLLSLQGLFWKQKSPHSSAELWPLKHILDLAGAELSRSGPLPDSFSSVSPCREQCLVPSRYPSIFIKRVNE